MELAFPIAVNGLGSFTAVSDYTDVWRQRVVAVLATLRGTRAMRSGWGTEPATAMFDNYTEASQRIRSIVSRAFIDHLGSLRLERVDVSEGPDGAVVAEVWYRLPNGAVDKTQIPVSQTLYGVVQ